MFLGLFYEICIATFIADIFLRFSFAIFSLLLHYKVLSHPQIICIFFS